MGVDIGGAHWTYSGFHRFRVRLCWEIGITLDNMEGFGAVVDSLALSRTFNHGMQLIPWANVNDHIVDLIHHSDCDGELTPGQCETIAPRLRELIERWPENDRDREEGERLADAMNDATASGEPLEFR